MEKKIGRFENALHTVCGALYIIHQICCGFRNLSGTIFNFPVKKKKSFLDKVL